MDPLTEDEQARELRDIQLSVIELQRQDGRVTLSHRPVKKIDKASKKDDSPDSAPDTTSDAESRAGQEQTEILKDFEENGMPATLLPVTGPPGGQRDIVVYVGACEGYSSPEHKRMDDNSKRKELKYISEWRLSSDATLSVCERFKFSTTLAHEFLELVFIDHHTNGDFEVDVVTSVKCHSHGCLQLPQGSEYCSKGNKSPC